MSGSTRTLRMDVVATAASLGALICWSIGPIFIRYLAGYVDSWTQNAMRYSVAGLFWLPFVLLIMIRGGFDASIWRRAILPSVANIAMQSLWAAGFYYLDPAFMTLLTKTSILWVAGFSLIFFREERPLARSYRFWLGCLLSLAGVAGVLYFHEGFSTRGTLVGIVIALAEAFMWAVYTISVKVAFRGIDSRCSFSVISLYTTVGLWICSFLFGRPSQIVEMGYHAWMAVLISAVTSIALAHVLFYVAIQRIGTTLPVLVVLAQPFAVFGLSSLIFQERLSDIQLLFGAVLLLGSGLSIWAQQHLRPEPSR